MLDFRHDDEAKRLALSASLIAAVPILYILYRIFFSGTQSSGQRTPITSTAASLAAQGQNPSEEKKETKSIMQAPKTDLAPPKEDPYTQEQLKEFDGSSSDKPIYVAIKGTVFDVTHKKDFYGPGASYNIFAGKDGSRGLGMSSLKPEDAVPDYSVLDEKDMKTLNDWHDFFKKRYNIVGRVSDLPPAVADKIPSNL